MYYLGRKKKDGKKDEKKKREKPNLVDKLDRIFALYIRLRDISPNGYGRCISCGRPKHFSELQCGHFHSRRHMNTRYDEDNCHAECAGCNCFSADHLIAYEENLIRKIGRTRYDLLKVKAKQPKQWSDFELEVLIKHYKAEVKRLSADKNMPVKV